jgi:hypothetical protein
VSLFLKVLAFLRPWHPWREDRTTGALTKQYFHSLYMKTVFPFTMFSAPVSAGSALASAVSARIKLFYGSATHCPDKHRRQPCQSYVTRETGTHAPLVFT